MTPNRPSFRPGAARATVASGNRATRMQGLLVCLVLAASLFLPRQGMAVLLVPLGRTAALDGMLPRNGALTVLGAGRLPGSVLVRFAAPVSWAGLVERGVVPLAVPAVLCSQSGPGGIASRH